MIAPTVKTAHPISDTALLERVMRQLESRYVSNGVLSGIGAHPNSKEGATVAMVAAWNEYGTIEGGKGYTPSRPFMRLAYSNFMQQKAFIRDVLRAGLLTKDGSRLKKSVPVNDIFTIFGMKIQSLMVANIDSNMAPENAAATVAKKGSAHTLFDTGILKKSITFKVESNQ